MNIEPLIAAFNRHIDITPEEQNILRDSVTYRKYLKGQYLVQQGDICKFECYILKGCSKTFYVDREGQEHIVMFAVEDWWTADLGSFITQSPALFNVQCIEDTEVIQFQYEVLENLYRQIPRLERFFRIIIQNALITSERRIVRNFSLPAKERYIRFQEQYPLIEQRVPQYMIASYLGITKEFLSKIRNQIISEQSES